MHAWMIVTGAGVEEKMFWKEGSSRDQGLALEMCLKNCYGVDFSMEGGELWTLRWETSFLDLLL
jgi:hypothetical protein